MWGTVLFFALICAVEPTRIGVAAMLVALPRPFRNLLAFWAGLVLSGGALALVGMVLLRDYLPRIVQAVRFATSSPALPPIKIAFGVLAISIAAMLVARSRVRQMAPLAPVPVPVGGPSGLELQPDPPSALSVRALVRGSWTTLVENGSVGMAFMAGLATSAPPLEFWPAVLAILASGATAGTQASAVLLFLLVAYAIAEIPLICYLAAPSKTRTVVTRVHNGLRVHRRPIFLSCLGAFGVMLIANGVGCL
ncbi:GAP family protein [Mycobacterium conspicuum]|jgi:hypothetical protein|uniref:Uncharacterized protein n=1 Tax=Mycobacterium conspicuum TaxID=44010 RepID=A0A1X1TDF9_9MYCO|nr:GAP family protein [Mycobacterium conspicuum]ORV42591.1 hypothetical protein AWC00_11550 [Mycobacterium conspicuum]BBZ39146.1 hypothetical protein MCNS_22090 [Mycobacterium conspicuum]